MSFRRFVGKTVQITSRNNDGGLTRFLAKLFTYDDTGIWFHREKEVELPDGGTDKFEGLMFMPHVHVDSVFASDELNTRIQAIEAAAEGEED